MKKPRTLIERLNCVETYVRTTEPAFPNSTMCFDVGLLLKAVEIEGETLPPAVSELVVKIIGSLHALFDTIDTNGPNAIRDTYRNETFQHLADLREFVLVNKIRTN